MSRIILIALIVFLSSCNGNKNSNFPANTDSIVTAMTTVEKGDIMKIKWIEGNWKGMAHDKPFYEQYQLKDDSMLSITTYDYNGKDTSNTDHSYVKWEKDAFYLGDSMNYKVIEMNESRIVMKANYHADNDILWAKKDTNSWDVALTNKRGTTNYLMQRIAALDSLIKRK